MRTVRLVTGHAALVTGIRGLPAVRTTPLRLAALIHVTRPQIAAQAAAYTLLGAYLSAELRAALTPLTALAALIVALVVAFGFVINDYADADLDHLSKPERPIPAGAVSRPQAVAIALILAALILALSLFTPLVLQLIALLNLVLTAAYSLALKRTVLLGNLTMALLNSSILLFGSLAAGGLAPLIWAVVAMSFLYTLAQEVLYTVDDAEGDARAGIVTTAVAFGVGPALHLFRALISLALLCAAAPLWLAPVVSLYLPALLLCVVLPVAAYILPLTLRATPATISQACAGVKLVRLAGLVPLVLLGVPV